MTLRQSLRRVIRPAMPRIFSRTSPLSQVWGFDRGKPVDRYYIEKFLRGYRHDIAGRTLEVADTGYTKLYGTEVARADVLDIDVSNREATLIADLSVDDQIPQSEFDCFILTQTLHLIYDMKSAVANSHRLLRPGGVLLATVPSVSRIAPDVGEDCWRFTVPSCLRLFSESFGAENTMVRSYGNVLTCVAFLQGMACEELSKKQLAKNDAAFPLVICIRAVKPR